MGQRHQLYIKIHNPVTRAYDQDKPNLRKIFGRGKFSIVAIHHQWLFGRSAIGIIRNIFDVSNPETLGSSNPFNPEGYIFNDSNGFVEELMQLITTQCNPDFPRGTGIEKMIFLNSESMDYTKDFTLGDNNDGISIIDTIERKYCLMNIYSQNTDEEKRNNVDDLPSLVPVSALDYVNVYYPEDPEKDDRKNDEIQKENIRVAEWLKDYELLTLKEIKKLAPNMPEVVQY